jgi:hypothetical protein
VVAQQIKVVAQAVEQLGVVAHRAQEYQAKDTVEAKVEAMAKTVAVAVKEEAVRTQVLGKVTMAVMVAQVELGQ